MISETSVFSSFIGGWLGGIGLYLFSWKKLLWNGNPFWFMVYLSSVYASYKTKSFPGYHTIRTFVRDTFRRHFRYYLLTPPILVEKEGWKKPQVIIAGPHGIFILSVIRTALEYERPLNLVLALDDTVSKNPFMHFAAHVFGGNGIIGLKHNKIQEEMKQKRQDIAVIAGGFVEAATCSETRNTLYHNTWSYWVLQCLRHGFDISFTWNHGGSQTYHQGNRWLRLRQWLSERSIPFVQPWGKWGTFIPHNDVPMYNISFRYELPHLPDATCTDAKPYLDEFYKRVRDLFEKYPPSSIQAPVIPITPLQSRL